MNCEVGQLAIVQPATDGDTQPLGKTKTLSNMPASCLDI